MKHIVRTGRCSGFIAFAAAMHAGFNIGNIAIAILLQYDPGPAFLLH